MAQVMLFHRAAIRGNARDRMTRIVDQAVAYHAKQQDRSNYLKQLEKITK